MPMSKITETETLPVHAKITEVIPDHTIFVHVAQFTVINEKETNFTSLSLFVRHPVAIHDLQRR